MPDSRPPTRWDRIVSATTGSATGTAASYRARLLSMVILGMLPVLVLVTALLTLVDIREGDAFGVHLVTAPVVMAALVTALVLNSRGHATAAAVTVVAFASGAVVAVVASGGNADTGAIAYLGPVMIVAGFFLAPRAIVLLLAAQAGAILLIPIAGGDIQYHDATDGLLVVVVCAALAFMIAHQTDRLDSDRSVELATHARRYRMLFDSNPWPMWVYDLETLAFLAVNDAATRHYGYSAAEFLSMDIRDIRPPEDIPALMETLSRSLGGEDRAGLWRHRTKDTAVIDVEIYTRPIVYDGREAELTLAMDVTERRRAQREGRALTERMRQAQKLESLGLLAGGVAHDFNNILAGILGHAELVRMQLDPASPTYRDLQEIESAAGRAADLAKQMLAYSGRGRFEMAPLSLNELVGDVGRMLSASISKKASVQYDLSVDIPAAMGDITQIRQLVMNLMINAAEALGEDKGIVKIATDVTEYTGGDLDTGGLHADIEPGLFVLLEVTDTGVGMDAETASRVFDPFFSTKFTGRGLGLAVVAGIVRGHHGTIQVHSRPNGGTTFRVLLPATEEPVTVAIPAPEPATTRKGRGTILLVDDERPLRRVGARMLAQLGFDVLTAADGREAVELFEQRHDEIACVILDLTMPRMDGKEAHRQMQRLYPDIPVILSSGYDEQEVSKSFADQEVAGFLQKPYELATLAAKLQAVLA